MSDSDVLKLKNLLDSLERDIKNARRLMIEVEKSTRKDYKDVPGVTGTFDGFYLISETGEKYEVPQNYSAKSRLVFGDTLKMVEDEGKQLFKQIAKVERKKVEGVVNKKEGKWYVLTADGSYRLNDAAVDFHSLQINDKITVVIPEESIGATYAALEKVPERVRKVEPSEVAAEHDVSIHSSHKQKSSKGPSPRSNANKSSKPKQVKETVSAPKKEVDLKEKKEYVEQISNGGTLILGDDDLR